MGSCHQRPGCAISPHSGAMPVFPIVFAFQNAALAPSLDPGFDLTIWDPNGSTAHSPMLDLKWTNFTASDPTYVYRGINLTDGGAYRLVWSFGAGNCSGEGGPVVIGGGFRGRSVDFTIENGAQQPDLMAATAGNVASCTHFAFNLTGTLDVPLGAHYDGRNTCAVFSDVNPLVAGDPCAVQVSSATASSISAALVATACAASRTGMSCPSSNVAPRWPGHGSGYAA